MRTLFFILAFCCTNLLVAQTIDQKLEKLAAKGYFNKEYISSIKQLIALKGDSVTEGAVLNYLYTGDQNFNSSGMMKDDLTKMKKATKSNPNKVLKDMVTAGLIENDSSVAWVKREMRRDTQAGLMRMTDIYTYLNEAGQYEDAIRLPQLQPVLRELDTLGMLSDTDTQQLTVLAQGKKLNSIWDVFSRCKNVKVVSQNAPVDNGAGVKKRILVAASLCPEIVVTDLKVEMKHVGPSIDSIYISLTCDGKEFHESMSTINGSVGWDQIENNRVFQVVNKALTNQGIPKRIYEIMVNSRISGANTRKGLAALSGEEHFQLQQLQHGKSGTAQLFRLYPN